MSNRYPSMPLHIADYELDTKHLTAAEDGIYGRLLRALWVANGSLPADDKFLARTCRISLTIWRRSKATILPFFRIDKGQLSQKRVSAELAKAEQVSRQRSKAGKGKGKSKTGITYRDSKNVLNFPAKSLENNDVGSTIAEREHVQAPPSPKKVSPVPPSKNHPLPPASSLRSEGARAEARSTHFDPKQDVQHEAKERKLGPPVQADFDLEPDEAHISTGKGTRNDERGFRRALSHLCLAPEVVDNLVVLRRNKRGAPITPHAGRLLAGRLMACGDAEAAANMLIERGWTSIEPDWFQRAKTPMPFANGHRYHDAEAEEQRAQLAALDRWAEQGGTHGV